MQRMFIMLAMTFQIILMSCNNPGKKNQSLTTVLANVEPQYSSPENEKKQTQKIPLGTLQFPAPDSAAHSLLPASTSNPDWNTKIIKTASLNLEVKDFKRYNELLAGKVKQAGGYIAREEQNITPEKYETTISIKVPVFQFDALLNDLPGNESRVMERTINSDDVTGKIVDTKSRVDARKEMRLKYLEFLKQSKNMTEALEVQSEINSIQEEIEAAANQVNYLSHQAALSTINLKFFQALAGYAPVAEKPSFIRSVSAAFKNGSDGLAKVIVGLTSVWPFLVISIVIFFTWKRSVQIRPINRDSSILK